MSSQADTTLETIEAMRLQEAKGYQVTDYLAQIPAEHAMGNPVDATCRFMMAKWCNDIADFCKYSHETASIAISCLDRFMASPGGAAVLLDRDQFQLAAMTAFYSAVKIHEHEAMDPALVSSLSRGAHSPEAVEAMEFRMLNAIQWRMNPPTAHAFVRLLLDLVPAHLVGESERETISEMTNFQIDLSTLDYKFASQVSASTIAFAALLNAVESVISSSDLLQYLQQGMAHTMKFHKNESSNAQELRSIRIALYESINEGSDDVDFAMDNDESNSSSHEDSKQGAMDFSNSQRDNYHSPRSVSA